MSEGARHPAPDTIAGLTQGLEGWFEVQEPGVVWVRYKSDLSRDALLRQLQVKRAITILQFDPPSADQACVWLEGRLKAFLAPGSEFPVVAVVFPVRLQGTVEIFLAAFRSLNLRREDLLLLPLIQLWVISDSVSAMAELESPDLVSWFKLRFWLNEIPALGALSPLNVEDESTRAQIRLAPLAAREQALADGLRQVDAARASSDRDGEAFLPDLAMSLNNLATMQSAVGRREEALGTAEEAVKIRRELARRNEEAFLPDLATSLGAMSQVYAAGEDWPAAHRCLAEAVPALLPVFEALPPAYAQLMLQLTRAYLQACEAAQISPNADWLARIVAKLPQQPEEP